MQIGFFTLGSRGDVQPVVALAKGFADAGHDVRFVSDESTKPLVLPYGISGHFLCGNLQERFSGASGQPLWNARNPYALMRVLSGLYADLVPASMQEAADAMQGCKLLIMSKSTLGIGYGIAEKIRAIPCEIAFAPGAWSRHMPTPLVPASWWSVPMPVGIRRLLHEAALRATWLGMRDVSNAARRALGVREISWPFGRGRPALLDAIPQLYGFSPTLVPRPPDWPKNITITGFWHHRHGGVPEPPPALAAFLAAGSKPIYVGFGSAVDSKPQQLREIVVRAVRRLGLRAIVSRGWGGMAGMESAEDILVVDDVPHDWLFPRVAAVVCHGGAGTVAAVLRSGTPAVIVPYIYDQPFWGWALARLGIAPRMIPRRRLSVERLTASLRQAITDDVMRQRAREASECVQAEDGVRRAVEAIDRWLSPTLVGSGAAKRASRAPEPKPV